MKKPTRFQVLETENPGLAREVSVLVDTQTGVQYLLCVAGYAGGLTPLLGADGKPMIVKVKE